MIRTYVRSTVSILAVAAVLGGCSLFHHHDNYYSKATESRPLEVPPDLDAPPATNALNVPASGSAPAASATSSAPPAAASMSTPPPASVSASGSNVALTGNGLHVTDSVEHTWQRVGIALDRAQLGTVSERNESARSYTLEVSGLRAAPAPEATEHHWYTRVLHPFGGGKSSTVNAQPVSGRLTVKVISDGDGSRVDVEGAANDSSASEAARRVLDALRERLS
ncbi:MAG: hypothetical protein ABJB01_10490 [Rudaea sp.]